MTANVIQIEERNRKADRVHTRLVKTTPVREAQTTSEPPKGSQGHREQEGNGDKIDGQVSWTHAVPKRQRGVNDKSQVPRYAKRECQSEVSAV